MRIKILGTANAWGSNEFLGTPFPLTGTLANGTTIEFRRYRTSLFLESRDGKRILIDCGPDFAHQRRQFQLGRLDAILFTHPHPDHILGVDEVNVYKEEARHRNVAWIPIPAYADPSCWQNIRARGFAYIIDALHLVVENPLQSFQSLQIGTVTITPFSVEHSVYAPGAVGFIFTEESKEGRRRVIYTGDLWAVCDPTHPVFREPVDLLIMECDRWDGLAGPAVGGGHMSLQEAIRFLNDGVFSSPRPKQVCFVHFGDNGPQGPLSTYRDWRQGTISRLSCRGLQSVIPDEDAVIGHEGLTFTF